MKHIFPSRRDWQVKDAGYSSNNFNAEIRLDHSTNDDVIIKPENDINAPENRIMEPKKQASLRYLPPPPPHPPL